MSSEQPRLGSQEVGSAFHCSPNRAATAAMESVEPVLIDVLPAIEAVPGMRPNMILVSGPPMNWSRYDGPQHSAVIGAALYEGLASDPEEAETKLRAGSIVVGSCHDHLSVGSLTGACSASMPVLLVRDAKSGRTATCRMNEGAGTDAFTFGSQGSAVEANMTHIRDRIAPALARIVRRDPLPLLPIMTRALTMGDELHGTHRAAGLLFRAAILERMVRAKGGTQEPGTTELLAYLAAAEFHFLHIAMAAAKVITAAADGVPGSSIVTAMTMNGREFGVRISGAPDRWFRADLPPAATFPHVLQAPWTGQDLGHSGGDSLLMETLGLGAVAAAAAPILSPVSLGTPEQMTSFTQSMYAVAWTEHRSLRIPSLGGRGIPWGLDAQAIAARELVPLVHIGATLKTGGLAGSMLLTPPLQPFLDACEYLSADPSSCELPSPRGSLH